MRPYLCFFLSLPRVLRPGARVVDRAAARGGIAILSVYRRSFSPDHGAIRDVFGFARCRFFPSCSEYAADALRQYGLSRGIVVSLRRLARCHPWCEGGYDPVSDPNQSSKRRNQN